MKQKYLTLDDLYSVLCRKRKNFHFSSTEAGGPIVVQLPGNFSANTDSYKGLLPVTIKACHTNLNRNGSFISDNDMEKALPTIYNRPILGHIHQLDDGSYDFHSHDMTTDSDGNTHYVERAIGTIPESGNAHLEYDKEMDKNYVVVDGYIYEDYGNEAADILQEKGTNKVSVELCIDELSYNAKEKRLEINAFYFMGITCLGKETDGTEIGEGMLGSKLTLDNFSSNNNSLLQDTIEQLQEQITELHQKYDSVIKELEAKEGGEKVTKFEELLQKYGKTESDITFEIDGLTDEELEQKFSDLFAEEDGSDGTEVTDPDGEGETDPDGTDVTEPGGEEKTTDLEGGDEEEPEPEAGEDDEEDEEEEKPQAVLNDDDLTVRRRKYSVEANGKVHTYEVSLDEVIYALETVVNDTYSEADNAYYGVKVYDKYVVMVDYWTGKAYKQNYKQRNGVYTLTGDRVEVYSRYLTKEEENALDEMRSKYAVISEELEKYRSAEEATKKDELLASADYALIAENQEFKALVADKENYSLEDLTSKCDALLLASVKSQTFSQKNPTRKVTTNIERPAEYKPYGDLFPEK